MLEKIQIKNCLYFFLFYHFLFYLTFLFSIITLGGSKANIEALKAYEKNYILEYQSLVNNKLRELSSKTIPELSSFKRTITEINLNENSISNDKGEILRNSKQLISETQSLILKIENNSNIDYKEIQNTLYNNIDNKNLKDLQKQIKLNIQKTKKIFLDKIYFVTEIKNKIKSLNTSLINSLKLIETKKSKTKFKKYIKRLDDTLNRLQLEQTRLNNLINKTYNINDIQEEIKNINNFKLESTSSLIYSKWTMIWDRFAIAILLDFVALILFPAFIGLIWYTNAKSKKGQIN